MPPDLGRPSDSEIASTSMTERPLVNVEEPLLESEQMVSQPSPSTLSSTQWVTWEPPSSSPSTTDPYLQAEEMAYKFDAERRAGN